MNIAEVRVPRERHSIVEIAASRQIQNGRTVRRVIGLRVYAGIVAAEKSDFLQRVSVQRVVGVGGRHGNVGRGLLPSELSEDLPHVGWRLLAPAIVAEQIAGDIPVQSTGFSATMLEFNEAA